MNKSAQNYYPIFDLLRFTLACIVILEHDYIFKEAFNMWPLAGNFSVQVFFALSGFLIGSILLKTEKSQIKRFFFNRAIRIWIPYFIAIVFVVLASLLKDDITSKWGEFMMYNLTFVHNIFGSSQIIEFREVMPLQASYNHIWSVNAEEQFYLLAPLLLVLANKSWGHHIVTWLIIAVATWYFEIYASISFGVLSVVIVNKYGEYYKKYSFKAIFLIVALMGGYAMYTGTEYNKIAPFVAISIVLLLAVKGGKNKIFGFLGGISYPLYLNQWIGVFMANAALKPLGMKESMLRVVLEVVLNIMIASTLYLMIEKPMLARRSTLYTEKRGIIVTQAAYLITIIGVGYGIYML